MKEKRKYSKSRIRYYVEVLLIMLIILIVVVIVLALLGPVQGNVFSNIPLQLNPNP